MSCIRPPGGLTGPLLALLAGSVAHANNEPTAPTITIHAYDEEATHERAEAVEAAAGDQLSRDVRLTFKPFSSLVEPSEDVPRLLGQADIQVLDADKSFGEMDLEKAKQLLTEALETYK